MSSCFLCYLFIVSVIANDFNWIGALDELQATKSKWATTGVDSYVLKLTQSSATIPFPCAIAPKYVLVKDKIVDHVEYDSQYLQSQNINCASRPLNMQQYNTIDGYYDMAISWAWEGILDNCNSSNPSSADTCGGSILFEYNPILFYPTKLKFILPQVGNEYPLHTISCLTVYSSNTNIQNFGNECNDFIPPLPVPTTDECKITQDECELNDDCCDGSCGISKWDTSKSVCCYDSMQNSLCRNDFDCCNGYACDNNMNLCVEQKHVIECGTPRNSGRNKLVRCRWDDDCCDGYKCNENNKKCVPRYNYGYLFNWIRLDEFNETKVYWLVMNLCVVMLYFCYNFMCRKSKDKNVSMDHDQSDKTTIGIEEI